MVTNGSYFSIFALLELKAGMQNEIEKSTSNGNCQDKFKQFPEHDNRIERRKLVLMRHGSMPTIYVDRVRSACMNE